MAWQMKFRLCNQEFALRGSPAGYYSENLCGLDDIVALDDISTGRCIQAAPEEGENFRLVRSCQMRPVCRTLVDQSWTEL